MHLHYEERLKKPSLRNSSTSEDIDQPVRAFGIIKTTSAL